MVFVFPFIRSYVHSFVELRQSFTLMFLKMNISLESHIRKHSYLGHGVNRRVSAFIP